MTDLWSLAGFGAGLVTMTVGTVLLARWARLDLGLLPLWAIARAVLQLSVIALLLRGILSTPWAVVGFVVLMLSTASLTAGARIRELRRGVATAVVGVLAGATVAIGAIYALQLIDLGARFFIAVAGIVIGNAMTAATLSGRNFLRAVRTRTGEIEAAFALGASAAVAHEEIGREAVREALLPTFDQTRSTGLVTLPGAFVGALFGGASPVEAAQFQLVVLAGIALAMTVTAVVVTRIAGRSPYLSSPT